MATELKGLITLFNMTYLKKIIVYKIFFSFMLFVSQLLPKSLSQKLIKFLLEINNKFVLSNTKYRPKNVLLLLPKCLQYFNCNKNIISSIENCVRCGKCKIKNILELKEKYEIELKVATGGKLAKKYVEELNPDFIVAVACEPELMLGIKEVIMLYDVITIPNIIVDKPCINTDVEVEQIESYLKLLVKQR